MPDYQLTDISVTTTVQTLGTVAVDNAINKSLYIINKGNYPVIIRIYGSPTGATVANFTSPQSGYATYTQAEIDLHYMFILQMQIPSNDRGYIDLSEYIYNFFQVTAEGVGGTTTINWAFQKAGFNIA